MVPRSNLLAWPRVFLQAEQHAQDRQPHARYCIGDEDAAQTFVVVNLSDAAVRLGNAGIFA